MEYFQLYAGHILHLNPVLLFGLRLALANITHLDFSAFLIIFFLVIIFIARFFAVVFVCFGITSPRDHSPSMKEPEVSKAEVVVFFS